MQILRRTPSKQLVAAGALLLSFGCGNGSGDDGGKAGASSGGTGNAAATGGTTGGAGSTTGGAGTGGTPSGGSAGDGAAGATGGGSSGQSSGGAGTSGNAGGPAAGAGGAPTWGVEARPTGQTCTPPASPSAQAALLSQTGCVDPADPKKPAATLIPYGVATPLWSDHAEKLRYFALPDDTLIHVKDCSNAAAPECQDPTTSTGNFEDEGDWDFPDKTVFVKTFAFEDKLVETRLLVRFNKTNWFGYSYQWREDQSDADLLASNTDGYDQIVEGPDGTQNWHFPSRAQCLQCHTTATGVSLGLETSQLNFDFAYPNGVTGNQLATLKHIGIFEAEPPTLPAYPTPSDATHSVEERARSYIHMNCGMCHRPGGSFTDWDGRYQTAFADMQLCDKPAEKAVPTKYALTDPVRLEPGHPETSVISLRMHELEDAAFRMPSVGSRVLDPVGTEAVDDWIASLTACP